MQNAEENDKCSTNHDVELTPLTLIKYTYSTVLLIFSVIIIMALIFQGDTKLAHDTHPTLAFFVIWIAIIWLSMAEGGQASLVGLPPVDRDLYKDSHPIAHKCTSLAHKGDNLHRYLMGRQFMVVLIVFVTNLSGAPLNGAKVFGWPQLFQDIFLVSGLAMVLMTCMIGQLNTQVNASHCMLDYLNSYFGLFTLWVAMGIEFTGLMHFSYVIQLVIAQLAGKPIISKEPPRDTLQAGFFWFRCIFSFVVLSLSLAVTFTALFQNKTTMWDGVPSTISVILFVVLLSVVGMLEAMQIAFFAVAKLPKEERGTNKFAVWTCDLLFRGNGYNLPGFMIGRQLCVVSCFFIIARVTTLDVEVGTGENIFDVSDTLQEFLNTGLHAAVITTILGSISWQLVASSFPIAVLSIPCTYILLIICLFLEATGIASGAWVLANIHRKIAGFQYDEVYIGTSEERVTKEHPNDNEIMRHLDGAVVSKNDVNNEKMHSC